MREIKFRVWDKKENKMNFTDNATIKQGEAIFFNFMIPWRKNIFSNEWELMQYTGLNDRSGKEIYEGDIVRTFNGIGLVKWSSRGGSFIWDINNGASGILTGENGTYIIDAFRDSKNGNEVKVIGNIYENPVLLGGSNEGLR